MSDLFVERGDVRLRYRIDGAPDRPWLAFSNSLMTDLTMWDAQVAAFGDDFRILRYDQRGHGMSSVPEADCTFPGLVDDLVAILDHAGIRTASVVGVSMGGVTALGLAGRVPDRVDRVAICDCQTASSPAGAAAWDERIAVVRNAGGKGADGMAALVEPTIARWFTPESVAAHHPTLDLVRRMIASTPVEGFVRAARALQDYDFGRLPDALRSPAAFIVGEGDGVLPGVMRAIADTAPGATFAAIAQAGHLPNIEQPGRFNAALAELLARPVPDRT